MLAHALARPATLGAGRLICLDGPAGAGKTTLAQRLRELAPDAVVLGTDEMLAGWRGLPGLAATVEALLRPLATGRPGRWPRWDWTEDRWAGEQVQQPVPLLVLEGVGCYSPRYAELVTTLAWVEASPATRARRAARRDGDAFAEHWPTWLADEERLHAETGTRRHADVLVRTEDRDLGSQA
ncbi:4-amino-4-deoxy-L-arabinose transferase [Nocardioides sp. zg-536]|uniref:4-amino-4-deoxy-L-arabinose transferase n=1 Tax=Nocardioides faecalis TaxID=2803858 RepID=A0A938Y5W3_9ACTN|nr:4-amino-4-deoxy-L-arabinose transferase [Nocardioides faecalis]MBM9460638.1 4-amino-4-deoxy-L-arabinose transferase [Nocardioides faecalis]QVI57444.1 4-amino-4-deoxy-L-arabinose transferase [Nocardioides faecalis]